MVCCRKQMSLHEMRKEQEDEAAWEVSGAEVDGNASQDGWGRTSTTRWDDVEKGSARCRLGPKLRTVAGQNSWARKSTEKLWKESLSKKKERCPTEKANGWNVEGENKRVTRGKNARG